MLPRTSLWLGLILSIVKGSFQGGIKPQAAANPLYQPDYGRAAPQTGNLGPLGAKAGGQYPQYPQYSQYPQLNPQNYQQGPFGLQNGYGGGLGYKPVKPAAGLGRFPQSAKRKPGYLNAAAGGGGGGRYPGNLAQQRYGGKAAKAGYGAGGYPNAGAQLGYGAGNYPNLGAQTGYGNGAANYPQGYGSKLSKPGYGNGAGNYLNNFPQQGYGNGAGNFRSRLQQQGVSGKPSKAGYGNVAGVLSARTGKPPKNGYGNVAAGYPGLFPQSGVGSKASKAGLYQQPYSTGLGNFLGNGKSQGALGQIPYRSQAADNLGYNPKAVKAGGSQVPYSSQAAYVDPAAAKYASTTQYGGQATSQGVTEDVINPSAAVEGPEGVTVWGTAPPATAASPRSPKKKSYKGGYQALGNGQSTWPYAPEEPAYGLTEYHGNGYRGCAGTC